MRTRVKQQAAQIIALTQQLFPPGILDVSRERDPEGVDCEYVVIEVAAKGTFAEISRRKHDWHDAIQKALSSDANWLRLIAFPQ